MATLFRTFLPLDRSLHGPGDIDSVFGFVTRQTWPSLSNAMGPVPKRKLSSGLSLFSFLGARHVRIPVDQLHGPGNIASAGTHDIANVFGRRV
jgi:hypothetical protein